MKSERLRRSDARIAQDAQDPASGLARIMEIMQRLRDAEGGCPWDQVQTHQTIAPYAVDEAYEVVDAIERDDPADLCDELGDLLLQVVYHAQIAAEAERFDMTDVLRAVSEKMIRRHPHVFGDAAEAPGWEAIKQEEKRLRNLSREKKDEARSQSVLDDAPIALPALARAVALQKRAASVGFDWPTIEPVLAKITEETAELVEARETSRLLAEEGDAAAHAAAEAVAEEFGDLLFVMANLARWLKIDPEHALTRANAKFNRRFRAVEAGLAAEGRRPQEASLAEMDAYWDAEKRREKAQKH